MHEDKDIDSCQNQIVLTRSHSGIMPRADLWEIRLSHHLTTHTVTHKNSTQIKSFKKKPIKNKPGVDT